MLSKLGGKEKNIFNYREADHMQNRTGPPGKMGISTTQRRVLRELSRCHVLKGENLEGC